MSLTSLTRLANTYSDCPHICGIFPRASRFWDPGVLYSSSTCECIRISAVRYSATYTHKNQSSAWHFPPIFHYPEATMFAPFTYCIMKKFCTRNDRALLVKYLCWCLFQSVTGTLNQKCKRSHTDVITMSLLPAPQNVCSMRCLCLINTFSFHLIQYLDSFLHPCTEVNKNSKVHITDKMTEFTSMNWSLTRTSVALKWP